MPKKANGSIFHSIAEKLLGIDNTAIPKQQLKAINEILSRFKFDTNTKDKKKLMEVLKKKHLVDSILVAQRNGSIVMDSNGNSIKEAICGTALFNYIQSEMPKSETVLIKGEKDWFMLFPQRENVFIVRAPSSMSCIELKALAKEIEETKK